MNTYTLPEQLLQAIVGLLSDMPSRSSRGVLNAIESEVSRQDKESADKATAEQKAAIRAEIEAQLDPKE